MRGQLPDHQLRSLITVRQVRDMLGPNTNLSADRFKDHPLFLPLHEQSSGLSDRSVLDVPMPFAPRRGDMTEATRMLRPLAKLCREHKVGEGRWQYDWYYLELLDREDKLHPVCWISTQLLQAYFLDDRPLGPPLESGNPQGRWPRQFRVMDHLPQSQAWSEPEQDRYAEWQDWFVHTWRKYERDWRREGQLLTQKVDCWTRMLGFDARLAEGEASGSSRWGDPDPETEVPLWLKAWQAGHSGIYWRMVPLYDIDDAGIVWHQMKRELFITSVFNIAAGPHQDPERWAWLEERFRHPFRRMSPYHYYIRYREQRVLEMSRRGDKLDEIAAHLVEEGLFPFSRNGPTKPRRLSAKEKKEVVPLARRVVVRIRTRLIREGAVQPRKRGRPRKDAAGHRP